jgi:hypothetical protein
MKKKKLTVAWLILPLVLSALCVAHENKKASPFERYRESTVNELEFRKTKFDVAAMRASLQPTPLPSGLAWIIHDFAGEKRKGALKD